MALPTITDIFGLGGVAASSDEGKQVSVIEVSDEKGAVVDSLTYDAHGAPSVNYKFATAETVVSPTLGNVTNGVALTNFNISTSAGSEPTMSASGEEVSGNGSGCNFECGSTTVKLDHHAQILFGAFSFASATSYLQSCNASGSCKLNRVVASGSCIAYDVAAGKIEVTAEIVNTGAAPTITAGGDWVITSPASTSVPENGFSTTSITLTKYLRVAE